MSDPNQSSYFLVVGPAGSGITSALESFGDFGFMQIGDIEPSQWQDLLETLRLKNPRIVFSFAIRPDNIDDLKALKDALPELKRQIPQLNLLCLDAPQDILVQRYVSSGKHHPFESHQQCHSLEQAVEINRKLVTPFKELKPQFPSGFYAIDTSTHTREELHHKVAKVLGINIEQSPMTVNITSFGFKNGLPMDAELVFDMRFLKNPYYVDDLRPLSGLDKPVRDFIFAEPQAQIFINEWSSLLCKLLPYYHEEGKLRLSIAIGCTGGQHRSVCMAQLLTDILKEQYPEYNIVVRHREKDHWAATGQRVPTDTKSS